MSEQVIKLSDNAASKIKEIMSTLLEANTFYVQVNDSEDALSSRSSSTFRLPLIGANRLSSELPAERSSNPYVSPPSNAPEYNASDESRSSNLSAPSSEYTIASRNDQTGTISTIITNEQMEDALISGTETLQESTEFTLAYEAIALSLLAIVIGTTVSKDSESMLEYCGIDPL